MLTFSYTYIIYTLHTHTIYTIFFTISIISYSFYFLQFYFSILYCILYILYCILYIVYCKQWDLNPHSFALLFPKNSLSTNFNMLTHFLFFYTMMYDISYIWSFIYIYYIPIPIPIPIPFENSILFLLS